MHDDERELIKRCQRGDEQALEQLFRRYQGNVYNVAFRMMGNPQDAEDVTQEVLFRVYQKISTFKFRSAFSTWLYRVTANCCMNATGKKRLREVPLLPSDTDSLRSDRTPEDHAIADERQALLWEAIGSLKEEYRLIIVLRDVEGLSYEELKHVLKCSMGRVKSRLHDARRALRETLRNEYAELLD